MVDLSLPEWNGFLTAYPDAHLLQCGAWGELKRGFGWRVRRIVCGNTGAQILFRPLYLGFTLAYLPKGPLGPDWEGLWPEVDRVCRQERAVLLKAEPDVWEAPEHSSLVDRMTGFIASARPIQPRRTVMVDLGGDEADVLGRMKQKTRYNIHLAEKKGVVVQPSTDIQLFHALMVETGQRDGFGVHSQAYYRKAYELFGRNGDCALLLATYENRPLGGLMVFSHGGRAYYLYGASSDAERNRMPAYLLQWEAMRWARSKGCREYDLWGVPDCNADELEAQFANRADGLWGVYRFKRGFGGEVRRSVGAWDRFYHPLARPFYRWLKGWRGAAPG